MTAPRDSCFVSWLLYNVKEDRGRSVYLEELYNNYKEYCCDRHLQPASKHFVTKVTEQIFPTMRKKHKKTKGTRQTRVLFCDLSILHDQDLENKHEDIIVPDFCEIHSMSGRSISFSVPTVYTLNGRTVNMDVSLSNSALTIRVGGVKIDLDEISFSRHVSYSQRQVNSLLRLAAELRLCRGVAYEARETSMLVEEWGRVGSPSTETRSRSNACHIVLGFQSKADTCASCQGVWRNCQKGARSSTRDITWQDGQQLQTCIVKLEGPLGSDFPNNDPLTCNSDRESEAQEQLPELDKVKVKVEVEETITSVLTCVVCGRHCKNAGGLRTHEKSHYNENRYVCQFCGRVCPNSSSFHRHVRTHTAECRAMCSQCGKRYKTMSALRIHERTHCKEKPFGCPQCPRRFTQNGSLRSHILLHEGGKRSTKESLRRFQCEVCGKKFAKKNGLTRHTLIHTGIKPHQCKFCGKGFSQSNTLDDHVKIHTGVRPHKCSVCSKTFIQKSNLHVHMKRHEEYMPGDFLKQARESGDQARESGDQARESGDLEKEGRASGDLEKEARSSNDLEKQASTLGNFQTQAREARNFEKGASASDDLENKARASGNLDKEAKMPGDLEKQARAGFPSQKELSNMTAPKQLSKQSKEEEVINGEESKKGSNWL